MNPIPISKLYLVQVVYCGVDILITYPFATKKEARLGKKYAEKKFPPEDYCEVIIKASAIYTIED